MSWLFGFFGKHQFEISDVSKFHPQSVTSFTDSNCYIAAGGNENLLAYQSKENQNKFFICGLGISPNGDSILSSKDWDNLLDNYNEIPDLNGHFCGVQIYNDSIKIFTDKTGLREIHILESKDGCFFSTRLDWLLKIQKSEIDFKVFSSRWLFFNQISNKSFIRNIIRLNAGSTAIITNNKIEIKECSWIPKFGSPIGVEQFREILGKFILLGEKQDLKISLCLSGGLDSRVLLSFLLKSNYKNWECNLFQTDSQMDEKIAQKILNDFDVPYSSFTHSPIIIEDLTKNLFEYVGSTYFTESAFISQNLVEYGNMSKNGLLIDGGFGEIWRREFLTRLLVYGKKAIESRKINLISKALSRKRADIFNVDVTAEMSIGIIEQLNEIIDFLPEVKEIGFGNWLDLFSIKTRLVNYYAPEQARLDNYVSSYMPYAQFGLLNEILNVPLSLRKNHKLFIKLFQPYSKALMKYNLAKDNLDYPFYFTSIMKRIYFLLHSKLFQDDRNKELNLFLNRMKEFTLDSVLSEAVKSYPYYNYKNIYTKINSYYKGETILANYVNWFITFEIFRQIVEYNN